MLTAADLDGCLALSTEAHWNQTEEDWALLLEQADPWGLELPDAGVVATAVGWDLPPASTWINMVLVTESCRGRGYARRLMQAVLERARDRGMAAALDATVFGAPVYERLGFAGDDRLVRLKRESAVLKEVEVSGKATVVPMTTGDMAEVEALDLMVLGARRSGMLQCWRERLPRAAWCQRAAGGELIGFVLGRLGRVATQVGPLIAQDIAGARALLGAVLSAGAATMIDVPVKQETLIELLQGEGFRAEREFRRMATVGGQLPSDWSRYFAAAGPDFA